MKNCNRLLSVILALAVILSVPFAFPASATEETNDIIFTVGFCEKTSLTETAYDLQQSHLSAGTVTVYGNGNGIEILLQPDDADDILLQGNFYLFTSGAYSGCILGGDFKTDSNIEIVTVKAEVDFAAHDHYGSSNPVLCIKYIHSDGDIRFFYIDLDASQFDSLWGNAEANAVAYMESGKTQEDYVDMVTALCFPFEGNGEHQVDPIELSSDGSIDLQCVIEEKIAYSTNSTIDSFSGFTYDTLRSFISCIRSNGITNFSDLGVNPNVFSQSYATRTDTITSSVGWSSAYDAQEYDGYRYVVLNIMDFKYTQDTLSTATEEVSCQLEIKDSIYFQYNPYTGEIMHLTNAGLKVNYVTMRITKIGGNIQDVFKTLERSGQVNSASVDVPTLLGLVPKLSTLTTLCTSYTTETTGQFDSGEYTIGNTYAEQVERYNGKVCRAIALESKQCYIKAIGNYMRLTGKVATSSTGSYRCFLSFSVDGFIG